MLDTLMLSRLQFAANISFHILFPMITIALAWVLLFFKLRYNATGDDKWMNAYRLWVKVFALSFAMGVVSGITMSFQFGTNWAYYSHYVGDVFGAPLAIVVRQQISDGRSGSSIASRISRNGRPSTSSGRS